MLTNAQIDAIELRWKKSLGGPWRRDGTAVLLDADGDAAFPVHTTVISAVMIDEPTAEAVAAAPADVAMLLAEVKRLRAGGVSLPGGDRLLGSVAITLAPGLDYSVIHPDRVHVQAAAGEWSAAPPTEPGAYWLYGPTGTILATVSTDNWDRLIVLLPGHQRGALLRDFGGKGYLWGRRQEPPPPPESTKA